MSAILKVERGIKNCLFLARYHFGCKSFLKRGAHLEAWAAHTHPKPTRVLPSRGVSSMALLHYNLELAEHVSLEMYPSLLDSNCSTAVKRRVVKVPNIAPFIDRKSDLYYIVSSEIILLLCT